MAKPILCRPELLQRDLSGSCYLITGANSGIGFETAQQLARQGARVVLACRSEAKGQGALEKISQAVPGAQLEVMELNLASLASVRAFAARFLASHDRLDGLVNNAGVMNTPRGKTEDGFESQFGTNHLGHFLLTELLLDLLKKSAPARIVNLSSCYHDKAMGREGDIHFDDLQFERTKYDGWRAYAQSKLANLLHAQELGRRLAGTGVVAVSVHPGWVRTSLMRHSLPQWIQDLLLKPLSGMIGLLEPWEGAQVTLHALLAPEVLEHPGEYFSQLGVYREKSAWKGGLPLRSPSPQAHDAAKARRLWEVSEQLVHSAGEPARAGVRVA